MENERMSTDVDRLAFNRGAIRPIECFRAGWELIREDYWLFFGITMVVMLLGGVAMGIMMGPMMCGFDLCLLRKMDRRRVKFDLLFQGFQYFTQGMIIHFSMLVPSMILGMLSGMASGGAMVILVPTIHQGGDPTIFVIVIAAVTLVTIILMLVSILISAMFLFAYPLLVEHELTALEAIRLSSHAAFANLGGIFALMLIGMLLVTAGLFMCYVGIFLVMPVYFAAIAVAYRQVFPVRRPHGDDDLREAADEPEPDQGPGRPAAADNEFTGTQPPGESRRISTDVQAADDRPGTTDTPG